MWEKRAHRQCDASTAHTDVRTAHTDVRTAHADVRTAHADACVPYADACAPDRYTAPAHGGADRHPTHGRARAYARRDISTAS